ncbi:hypothetical protein FOCC_FOCC016993 [Frankliniella occidentalis]|nr:hypothetical protein FOCC_FOCC016993 [Frankliniella occidentalis]
MAVCKDKQSAFNERRKQDNTAGAMVDATSGANNHANQRQNGSASRPSDGAAGQVLAVLVLVLETLWLQVRIWAEVVRGVYLTLVPPAEKSVAGEVVLVTGAGHGIGREIALRYAALGSTVVCDVSNRDEVLAVAKTITQEVGPVTVLVNNAGIMPTKPFLEHSAEEMKRIFDINMLAHFWVRFPSLFTIIPLWNGPVEASSRGLLNSQKIV